MSRTPKVATSVATLSVAAGVLLAGLLVAGNAPPWAQFPPPPPELKPHPAAAAPAGAPAGHQRSAWPGPGARRL